MSSPDLITVRDSSIDLVQYWLTSLGRVSGLGERVLSLERTLSEYDYSVQGCLGWKLTSHSRENDQSSTSNATVSHEETSSKRRRLDQPSCSQSSPQSSLDIGSTTHHAEQARAVIQGELKGNERMDYERQAILKSALQFVDAMAQGRGTSDKSSPSLDVSSEDLRYYSGPLAPSPELFYMLLSGTKKKNQMGVEDMSWSETEPTTTSGRSGSIQWPDHISDRTLQKMASTILSDTDEDHGQVFYQYCICVYVKAIFHLFQKPRAYKDPHMKEQFLRSKKLYEISASRALNSLNFLNAPTLPFVQSLISAVWPAVHFHTSSCPLIPIQAFLMQYLGNMSHCWILNSYAARLIVALDYHEVRNPIGNSELDEEIHSAVYWCFYLDRTLSTLLCRPMSLPEPPIPPTYLVSDNQSLPYIPLVRILLELAQIQGELLDCGKAGDTRQILASHSILQERMEAIHSRLESVSRYFFFDVWVFLV